MTKGFKIPKRTSKGAYNGIVQGLLHRRKPSPVSLREARSPFALPERDDPDFYTALVSYRERAGAVAVANGLPAVGARMTNAHGIDWVVDAHEFVPSVMTMGRGIERGDDPRMLYPVIRPTNLGGRIDLILQGIHLSTPKALLPLDTVPHLRPGQAAPHAHSVDAISHPGFIPVFLDAARVHETAFAHELGHVWLETIEGIEDYRVLEDLSEAVRYGQVQLLQSFVLDFAVNGLIGRRGFDLAPILDDRRIALEQMAVAVAGGYRPPTPWESVFMATVLAEAMVEESAHPVRADGALSRVREGLPEAWELALALAAAVRETPPTSAESAIRAIDRVLTLAFAHAGERLDLERDLIHRSPSVEWRDKWPEWLPGLPPQHKAEVGKAMARQGFGFGARAELRSNGGATLASFRDDGREWSAPVALPFRHPDAPSPYADPRRMADLDAANRKRQEEKTGVPKPVRPNVPTGPKAFQPVAPAFPAGPVAPGFPPPLPAMRPTVPGPTMPPRPGVPGRRSYSTGLGRFITQVRMEQMLAGESPYGYAFDNPTTYVDPSGNSPQKPSPIRPPIIGDPYRAAKDCKKCLQKVFWEAQANHTNPRKYCGLPRFENDMLHCIGACKALRECGEGCAQNIDFRDLYSWLVKRGESDDMIDIGNNQIGRCMGRQKGGQCFDLCLDALIDRERSLIKCTGKRPWLDMRP